MAKRQVMFTFTEQLTKEPIIYDLGIKFNVITNIRRADISDCMGWAVLELEGNDKDIEKGLAWVTVKGVRVDPVVGDIIEG
jgi:ABC-type methionine transport system ATPase subunit